MDADAEGTTRDHGVREAVDAHIAAVNGLDAEAVAAGFAVDGELSSPDAGAVGQRELYRLFRDAFVDVVAIDLELVGIVVVDDSATCELLERIRWTSGAALELRIAACYTVADGLITHARVDPRHGPQR